MLFITAIVASLLSLILIKLSLAVIALRREHKVSLGTGGHDALERAIRAQANFAEYVPTGLILLACLEVNGAPWWMVLIPGLTLILGRVLHALGINQAPPNFSKRVLGMKFTFHTLIALAVLNMAWSVYHLIA